MLLHAVHTRGELSSRKHSTRLKDLKKVNAGFSFSWNHQLAVSSHFDYAQSEEQWMGACKPPDEKGFFYPIRNSQSTFFRLTQLFFRTHTVRSRILDEVPPNLYAASGVSQRT